MFVSQKLIINKYALEKDFKMTYFIKSLTNYSIYFKEAKSDDILVRKLNFVNSVKIKDNYYIVNLIILLPPTKSKEIISNSNKRNN